MLRHPVCLPQADSKSAIDTEMGPVQVRVVAALDEAWQHPAKELQLDSVPMSWELARPDSVAWWWD